MSKILVVYIATGPYIAQYGGFRSSLKAFCPSYEKQVVVMTDKVDYVKNNFYGDYLPTIIPIHHQPWPIPALLKFHYIKQAMDSVKDFDYEYVCYFNANTRFNRELYPSDFFSKDKLTVTSHWWWKSGGEKVSGVMTRPTLRGNAALPDDNYIYVQSGLVAGPKSCMYQVCNWIIEACNEDLKSCIIPNFHDESYLNAYCYHHPDRINILHGLTYDGNRLRDLQVMPHIMYTESQITQDFKSY